MFFKSLIALGICFLSSNAFAHPVSFKDGFGIMPSYMGDRKELEINYSITHKEAIAFTMIDLKDEDEDFTFFLPQYNYKLYRQNEIDSQMNLYGSIGAGIIRADDEDTFGGLAAFQADYETRRVYTLLATEQLLGEDDVAFTRVRYRFGVAPYLGNFNSFHTWLIGQVEYTPQLEDEWTITPLLRFFYRNYLIEVGSSTRRDIFVAGIFHF